jgi:hypothetical protein
MQNGNGYVLLAVWVVISWLAVEAGKVGGANFVLSFYGWMLLFLFFCSTLLFG